MDQKFALLKQVMSGVMASKRPSFSSASHPGYLDKKISWQAPAYIKSGYMISEGLGAKLIFVTWWFGVHCTTTLSPHLAQLQQVMSCDYPSFEAGGFGSWQ